MAHPLLQGRELRPSEGRRPGIPSSLLGTIVDTCLGQRLSLGPHIRISGEPTLVLGPHPPHPSQTFWQQGPGIQAAEVEMPGSQAENHQHR